MVVLTPEEARGISDDVRLRVLEYVLSKGVRPRDIGVSSSLINMVKSGKRKVSDQLLILVCKYLSPDELRVLIGEGDYIVIRRGQKLSELEKATLVNLLAMDKELRAFLRGVLKTYEEKDLDEAHTYYVMEGHLRKFERIMRSRSKKTRDDYLRYLRRALAELNWKISPSILREYMDKVKVEHGPYVACHISKPLKLFIKEVIRDQVLYSSFKTVKPPERPFAEAPTLEEVQAVAKAIMWPPAKAYYVLLAETGLRPGELYKAKLSWLKLKARMLTPCEDLSMLRVTKKAYISFFSEKTREYLEKVYLPYRETWLSINISRARNLLGDKAEKLREKLFPFKPKHIRKEIYKAMDEALGRRFSLYALRRFFTTYMTSRRVPPLYVNIYQGRISPKDFKILQQGYLGIWLEDLKRTYDEAELCILCNNDIR